jgi:hypothetical protein
MDGVIWDKLQRFRDRQLVTESPVPYKDRCYISEILRQPFPLLPKRSKPCWRPQYSLI